MDYKYCRDVYIACYYTDSHHELRPNAFLDLSQDMATRAAEELDFSDPRIAPYGCVWVVARMHTKFLRPVKFGENVKMYTWHKGLVGVNFLRDYQMVGEDGVPAINSTSSWLIMDKTSRSITRNREVYNIVPNGAQNAQHAIEEPAPKIVLPRDAAITQIGSHRVNWSDVDINSHANNVKYTVWAMDALPEELVYNHRLLEHTINFNKEVLPGETVELLHAEKDGAHIIEGRVGDHQAFICRLLFD